MELCIAGALIILGVIVLVIITVYVRRKYDPRVRQDGGEFGSLLTIESVEEMFEKGLISEEEFNALRRRVLPIEESGGNDPSDRGGDKIEQDPEDDS